MTHQLTHLLPSGTGGVRDYVDVCLELQQNTNALPINEDIAPSIRLEGNILLHFSGYGYQTRGLPYWLIEKINSERKNIKSLGIYFHELYAFGPPWRSAFWLSAAQRMIARKLVGLCDYWLTNRQDSAAWLERTANGKPHLVLPVFSNVGENNSLLSNRRPTVVVFGGAPLRASTYRSGGGLLFSWVRESGLTVQDIGPPIFDGRIASQLEKNGVEIHGRLPKLRVSEYLAAASFGIVAYRQNELEKSGVFAAYCANGVCPIVLHPAKSSAKYGLIQGRYFAGMPPVDISRQAIVKVANAASKWYEPHSIANHISGQHALWSLFNE